MSARCIVGIDLGTTHTVVAFAELNTAGSGAQEPAIRLFEVPQLTAAGEVSPHPVLPSFRYHLADEELPGAEAQLPWTTTVDANLPRGVAGVLAQRLGQQVPGRLVASAKSWLSHAAVDRQAAILPWGAPEEIPKISPVQASAAYLAHIRAAWDAAYPQAPLAEQALILTVPASFDEGARALTLAAAEQAGLRNVRLLEEPQAAFYAWLGAQGNAVESALADVHLAVVVDVGGGTSDFSLIHIEPGETGPRLTRVAVGDHLMLGGDNMDVALARKVEARLGPEGARLPAARFSHLVQQCREVKERLLARDAPESLPVTVLGQGSRLVGGTRGATLSRDEVLELALDGFAPVVALDAEPARRRVGLVEFGLPYAADAAITRHLAAFLRRHQPSVAIESGSKGLPDAVLFNGGVFRSVPLQRRVQDILESFSHESVKRLDNPEPELAVARGAVAYGLARRGVGLKIGGGAPRSYFVEVDGATPEQRMGICVLPRGREEGEEVRLAGRRFALRVGEPVRFRLWTHAADRGHEPGDSVDLSGDGYVELPAIQAVLAPGAGGVADAVTVELRATLTEVGTLEMSCVGLDAPHRRYKLEFQLRDTPGGVSQEGASATQTITQLHPRFAEATELVRQFYGRSDKALEGRRIKTLRTDLERVLGERHTWDMALLRELFSALLSGAKRRRRSADHERLWLNLVGFCLRPGLGYPLDEWRVSQVWALWDKGLQYVQDASVWAQWWILWRRIAGGLAAEQQLKLADAVAYYLEPDSGRPRRRPKGPKAQGVEDMARMVGALERLPVERKVQLGEWLLTQMERGVQAKSLWWSVGRLGARAPLHGSAHNVVPSDVAERWLQRALTENLSQVSHAALAAAQLARCTGDRARDLPEEARERAVKALQASGVYPGWIAWVQEGGVLSPADQQRVFGESLPPGLTLL